MFNSDQTSVQCELASTRTLEQKGVKKDKVIVNRKDSTTHSHTLQPVISIDGRMITSLTEVLGEPNTPRLLQTIGVKYNFIGGASKCHRRLSSTNQSIPCC